MKYIFLFIGVFILLSCSEDDIGNAKIKGGWLIPKSEVFDGGPGKDGIPSIQNPLEISINQVTFLDNNDLVVLYSNDNVVHMYPHNILDWHEIVNDNINGESITVSYCPLTGSAIGLSGNLSLTQKTTFGVSGLLYNSNLILYDRLTDSYWSQMKNLCVSGNLQGETPKNEVLVETSFETAKAMFPDALVISNDTGIYGASRYDSFPYGSYKTNNSVFFPVEHTDNRFHKKERILGVFDGVNAKAYRFSLFSDGVSLINDIVGGESIVVLGDSQRNFMAAYKNHLQDRAEELTFTIIHGGVQSLFRDNLGNIYNILGQVIEGPNVGSRLAGIHSYIAYWFSLAAFYPQIDVE